MKDVSLLANEKGGQMKKEGKIKDTNQKVEKIHKPLVNEQPSIDWVY